MFAQRVGGDFSIESTVGLGTKVTLLIPREPMQLMEAV
jgi:signal transduction histidine kinase